MAFFGGGDDVTITINGQAQGLQSAVSQAQSSLQSLTQTVNTTNDATTGYRFTTQSLGNDLLDNLGTFGATAITLNSVLGVFAQLGGAVMDVVSGVAQFVEGLAQMAGSAAWETLSFGADEAERLGQAMFDLNNQTERNVTNWTFLYGGPNGGGTQVAQGLAAWSQKFSMQIPYTRQDLMSAITTLSAEPNANPADIEHQMQLLSDVASTQGRPGLTLAWAAQAALRASQAGNGTGGSLRMLMMDLNLNKGELEPYGYNEKDSATFWPALEGYEKGKGSYGASKTIATNTWWGAASSFEDRIQNFLLQAGGTDLLGQVQKGSFFGNMKQDLTDVSSWIDAHWSDLTKVADIISKLYGAGVETGTNGLEALLQTLHSTGIDSTLLGDLNDFGKWLGEPNTQAMARELGDLVGKLIGVSGYDLRSIFGSLWSGLTDSGVGQMLLDDITSTTQWLADPSNQQTLDHMGYILGSEIGSALESISRSLGNLVTDGKQFIENLTPTDLMLIAGAFSEVGLVIEETTNTLGGFVLAFEDAINVAMDYQSGNFTQMAVDVYNLQHDMTNTQKQNEQAWNEAVNQSAQLQILFGQWKQQSDNPSQTPGDPNYHYYHVANSKVSGFARGSSADVSSARVGQEGDFGNVGHGRSAGLLGATLTEGVTNGMVGDLSHLARAGQQIMGQFSEALTHASSGTMNSLGQHVADVLSQAITTRIAQEFRTQNSQSAQATQMPGGYGRFAAGGGRAPW